MNRNMVLGVIAIVVAILIGGLWLPAIGMLSPPLSGLAGLIIAFYVLPLAVLYLSYRKPKPLAYAGIVGSLVLLLVAHSLGGGIGGGYDYAGYAMAAAGPAVLLIGSIYLIAKRR